MAQASFNKTAANLWVSRIIPLVLIGIVGYVTWVVIALICGEKRSVDVKSILLTEATANYLINPPQSLHTPRHGAGIAIVVLYSIFLLLIGVTYFRLLFTVIHNPGYVPRGPQWYAQQEQKARGKQRHGRQNSKKDSDSSNEKSEGGRDPASNAYIYGGSPGTATTELAPSIRDFYTKDAFVCQGDGRPIWCSTCLNYKPDRAHHCSEIERCTRKMDHFCPW